MTDLERTVADLTRRLQALEDERAILRTMYAYGHALDYGDLAGFLDCWSDTAVLHWTGRPPAQGHEAIAAQFRAHTHAPDADHVP